jgi:hypothetical protein
MQIKFFNGNGKQFFIDNVYFWGNQATGIHDVVLPYTDEYMKVMINGHLIIIREGVKYTITGQVIQ